MTHIQGISRAQTLLLPACVDDYVGPDNVVRFIEAFVESLDLAAAGFERARPKGTGRPGYDPSDLLKLYIYGYLNRVRSSRRLEPETHRNLEVIWLMRQLQPDFKTIADFRRENKTSFRKIFREFVVLCRSLDLFGRELIAVDGTRLKAVNSGQRNFTKGKLAKAMTEGDERLARYLKQLDDADKDDTTPPARVDNLEEKISAIKTRRARLDPCGRCGPHASHPRLMAVLLPQLRPKRPQKPPETPFCRWLVAQKSKPSKIGESTSKSRLNDVQRRVSTQSVYFVGQVQVVDLIGPKSRPILFSHNF